ncbi:hypothetical protein C8Q79DRAFT_49918 [Trametes meyenii]|nr:hypothetical protein C8Q79DRAFT_49918 [Trametes meyenii]
MRWVAAQAVLAALSLRRCDILTHPRRSASYRKYKIYSCAGKDAALAGVLLVVRVFAKPPSGGPALRIVLQRLCSALASNHGSPPHPQTDKHPLSRPHTTS